MEFYLIANTGTLMHSKLAREYPRHLVLAQVYAQDPMYAAEVTRLVNNGCRVILDNGAHENIVIGLEVYARIANELRPAVVVLPDVVGWPARQSRDRCMEFVGQLDSSLGCEYIYAPQGQTAQESLHEYEWAAGKLDPDKFIIGIGQSYLLWQTLTGLRDEQARVVQVGDILEADPMGVARYHILGARWNPTPTFAAQRQIVGIDTVKPVHCALHGRTYPDDGVAHIEPQYMSRRIPSDDLLLANINSLEEGYGIQ